MNGWRWRLPENIGLALLDHIPVAKTLLTRHAMGLAERKLTEKQVTPKTNLGGLD